MIISGDLALVGVTTAPLFDENTVLTGTATESLLEGGGHEAMVVGSHDMAVGAWLGRLEAESVEKVDVGLGSMALVVGVPDDADLVQSHRLNEVLLRGEHGVHGRLLGNWKPFVWEV